MYENNLWYELINNNQLAQKFNQLPKAGWKYICESFNLIEDKPDAGNKFLKLTELTETFIPTSNFFFHFSIIISKEMFLGEFDKDENGKKKQINFFDIN